MNGEHRSGTGLERTVPWLIVLAVLLIYLPALSRGFLYDDTVLIGTQNPLHSVGEAWRVFTRPYHKGLDYYRPLTWLTFLVQRTVHGVVAWPFHLANILLGAGLAAAAYGLLRRAAIGLAPLPAGLAALAFAIAPVTASCVYPVSGRDTLLAALCTIGALAFWLRTDRSGRWLAAALCGAGLLSKELAVVIPALLVWADLLGLATGGRRPSWRELMRRHAPVWIVVVGYLAVRRLLFAGAELAAGQPTDIPLTFLYALQTTFTPFVELRYEPLVAGWWSWPRLAIAVAGAGALAAAAWRSGDARVRRQLAFWLGWWVLTLLPTANLLHQETRFDERYVLLSALAWAALAALVFTRWAATVRARQTVAVGALAYCAGCAAIGMARASTWEEEAFFRQWLTHRPSGVAAHLNLAQVLERTGRGEEALDHLQQAVRLAPLNREAHDLLGQAFARRGRIAEAITEQQLALGGETDAFVALNNLGSTLAKAGRLPEAIALFERVIAASPDYAPAHSNLGLALLQQGDVARAQQHLEEAVRLNPDDADAQMNLGILALDRHEVDAAAARLERAAALDPRSATAFYNLGLVREAQRRPADAIAAYRTAAGLDPRLAAPHNNLAILLFQAGQRAAARAELAEFRRLGGTPHPDLVRALGDD